MDEVHKALSGVIQLMKNIKDELPDLKKEVIKLDGELRNIERRLERAANPSINGALFYLMLGMILMFILLYLFSLFT